MPFSIRPFAECLAAFEALEPRKKTKKPGPVTKQDATHYDSTGAWSRHDLSTFPSRGPLESLHRFEGLRDTGIGPLDDGPKLVQWANFGNAVGTWNAYDEEGRWQCDPGAWVVALCELGRNGDDGYTIDVAFACWRVEDGYAVMITPWKPPYSDVMTRIVAVSGIAWPETFTEARLWYGE